MMKRARRGCIIFTGSTSGQFGTPLRAPYVAAKWAVNGLMKTIAMEAGPFGIRANVIAPGCVEGLRIERVIEREAAAKGTTAAQVRAAYEAGTSLRTFVTAGDVAAMAVFLASPAGERISGQVITLDGHTENPDPKV
jgi:NAD(P)-dependent dehydrogenase (short-subunit alcohol dehydrogenase family)